MTQKQSVGHVPVPGRKVPVLDHRHVIVPPDDDEVGLEVTTAQIDDKEGKPNSLIIHSITMNRLIEIQ